MSNAAKTNRHLYTIPKWWYDIWNETQLISYWGQCGILTVICGSAGFLLLYDSSCMEGDWKWKRCKFQLTKWINHLADGWHTATVREAELIHFTGFVVIITEKKNWQVSNEPLIRVYISTPCREEITQTLSSQNKTQLISQREAAAATQILGHSGSGRLPD